MGNVLLPPEEASILAIIAENPDIDPAEVDKLLTDLHGEAKDIGIAMQDVLRGTGRSRSKNARSKKIAKVFFSRAADHGFVAKK